MKVALAQINPSVGDIGGNSSKIISAIKKTNADIIAFPELCITGYSPQDLLLRKSFVDENISALRKIISNVKNKTAIIGFIEKIDGDLYNSAAVIQDRQIKEIHRKECLPNYSIFDEKRWFRAGNCETIFELSGKKIGISICEDIWMQKPSGRLKQKGAELIINISASPYGQGKIEVIESILKKRWEENKIPIIYVKQVGAQDGIVYYGHSMYFNDGKVIQKCRDFEEEILVVDVK